MKYILSDISLLIAATLALCGCSSSIECEPDGGEGDGCVTLSAMFRDETGSGGGDLADGCTIYISNPQGRIRSYNGVSQLPEQIWLMSGDYVAEAWAGDSLPASFSAKYYRGYRPFEVRKGETSVVDLTCPLANVVVSVSYDGEVKDALSSYRLKVCHKRGALVFEGDDTRKGYFMMPNGVKDLEWVLTAETFDGKQFVKSGTINNVKRATEYRLHFDYSGSVTPQGGMTFDLTVDKTEVDVYHEIAVNSAPVIGLDGMDIASVQQYERGKSRRHPVTIVAPSGLKSVTMTSGQFGALGLSSDTYSLVNPSEATVTALYSKGINIAVRHEADGTDAMVVNFSAKLCNLFPVGEYKIDFYAEDAQGKSDRASLIIKIIAPAQQ